MRLRCCSASTVPKAPNSAARMSITEVPARGGRPDGTGHVGKPAHHLHDLVERRALFVRPGQEAFQRAIDQPRIDLLQMLGTEPRLLIEPGAKFSIMTSADCSSFTGALPALRRVGVEARSSSLFLLVAS